MSGLDCRIIIVGGGLAGSSLAMALVERGIDPQKLSVVDAADSDRGSFSPATMLHPFPGRSMRLRRGQGEAFVRSWELIKQWNELPGGDWLRTAPMLRPLADDERGERLESSWRTARGEYPDPIEVDRLDPDDIRVRFRCVTTEVPGLVYSPAAAVDLPGLVDGLRRALGARGVHWAERKAKRLRRTQNGWRVELSDGGQWLADSTVLATGAALDVVFPELDLRRKAGEVALLEPTREKLPVVVNARKQVFERPDGLWGLGSTYFPTSEWERRVDTAVAQTLKAGVEDVVDGIREAEVLRVWRGVRGVFGSDHMPLVGPVPETEGLYVFGAFGSKGLLWAPSAARDLARSMTGRRSAISEHMDTRRIKVERWRPNRQLVG